MELNCLYDIEISPKDIFNSMKKNIYNKFSIISFTSISKEYLLIRNYLFNLIKKISSQIGFKSQTYFLSLYYLDITFSQNKKIDCNYNVLGLAFLLLSAKYCENDPSVPELRYFIKIYNRIVGNKNSITVSDLFYSEVIACKMLNHKLNYYTIYDFNSFLFTNNILKPEQLKDLNISDYNNNLNKDFRFSLKTRNILEKIYRKSRYYLDNLIETTIGLKYNTILISIYIMKKSIENILLIENNFNEYDFSLKEKFLKKTNDCFNSIIKGYYNFDYEHNPEYQKLIEDYDFIKIFKQTGKIKEDFSPRQRFNNPSNSLSKTPNKSINIKSLNQRISEINFSSTKNNNNLLKSGNIHNKMSSTNSLNILSEKNVPKVSQEKYFNLNQKILCRNLGIDNCIQNYRKIGNSNNDVNKLSFLLKLNAKKISNNNLNNYDIKNDSMNSTSPFKFGTLDKNLKYNFQKENDENNKKELILKKTKTKDFNKNNYSSYNNLIGNETILNHINSNLNKPYYKKVVQNYGNKLRNFNQISNKFNYDNNDDINLDIKNAENSELNNERLNKPVYNIVNRMPKYKLNNNPNQEEIINHSKTKINLNKQYSFNRNKDINISNFKKDQREETNSNKKEKKISKLLHINLNQKLSENSINTPLGSNFINKKTIEDFFSSTNYINKSMTKKFETKTIKPENSLTKSLNNKIINIRANQLNQNSLMQKKTTLLNLGLKDLHLKGINYDSNEFNLDKKGLLDYFIDSNENIFCNNLSTGGNGRRYSLITLKKNKEKETNNFNKNNKILLTDFTLSNNEKTQNLDGDLHDYPNMGIQRFNTKTFKPQNQSKRIQVKKNKFENDSINNKRIEKSKNYKKFKSINSSTYKGFSNKSNDFRNYYQGINDEDSNLFNKKNLLLYSLKNKQIEENNLSNIAQHFKKNPSTIVINNNININFGNKNNIIGKEQKRYKNIFKNSQIQINNNNGQNSISSLLNKIPLCYKNSENNINVRKKNYY